MNLCPRVGREEIAMDLSPMIDMVFLLLIFFIVASQVIDGKPVVDIPLAEHGHISPDLTGRLMISVLGDGSCYVGLDKERKTMDEVQAAVRREYASNKDVRVVIRADGDVRYETNKKITQACADIGIRDIIYSVFDE